MDLLDMSGRLLSEWSCSNKCVNLEFVRVQRESSQGFGVISFIAVFREHRKMGLGLKGRNDLKRILRHYTNYFDEASESRKCPVKRRIRSQVNREIYCDQVWRIRCDMETWIVWTKNSFLEWSWRTWVLGQMFKAGLEASALQPGRLKHLLQICALGGGGGAPKPKVGGSLLRQGASACTCFLEFLGWRNGEL
jgi:hypothetical protein